MKKIGFLATGDELCSGEAINTNTPQLAWELQNLGFAVGEHCVCADDETSILASLEFLRSTHDVIVITGGLGPTGDDRTRFAVASLLHLELVHNDDSWERLVNRFKNLNLQLTDNNRQQAQFPVGSVILPNAHGSADGCYLNAGQLHVFMLPGPPRECLPMFHQSVVPCLPNILKPQEHVTRWRVFGISESLLSNQLEPLLINTPAKFKFRWSAPYIDVRLHSEEEPQETLLNAIQEIVRPYIICTPQHTARELLILP